MGRQWKQCQTLFFGRREGGTELTPGTGTNGPLSKATVCTRAPIFICFALKAQVNHTSVSTKNKDTWTPTEGSRVVYGSYVNLTCNPMDYNPPIICPWDSLGKNNGVGCHALLQGIFLTHELNLGVLFCRQILYRLSHQGSPELAHVISYLTVVTP